jgi:hypothetical protein
LLAPVLLQNPSLRYVCSSLMESRNEEVADKLKKVKAELKKKTEEEYLDPVKSNGEPSHLDAW